MAGKRIIVGITGGIAAYKVAVLVRALRKEGHEVRVVMTRAGAAFVTPLTFQALSGHPVATELMDADAEAAMGHIELARWADQVIVAPASADFLARLAHGMADDLLTALCLATEAPIALAPAMNHRMWSNPATQDNVARLRARGIGIWGPAEGAQACGERGPGRMLEPEDIAARLGGGEGVLTGVRALVTAGPTREALDPVRFLGNRSSGKMGYAVAAALAGEGARVTLVTGPVSLAAPVGVEAVPVESAEAMRRAVMARVEGCDLFVAAAAVADYRPAEPAARKIKKSSERLRIELVRNPDILAEVASRPRPPFCVGFAAETEEVAHHAEEKRRAKGIHMIAANRVGGAEGGFESERNALTLLWEGGRLELPMMPKETLARQLVKQIAERYHAYHSDQDS